MMYPMISHKHMNCKNLKQKVNRKLYCKKLKSDIMISECSNCKYKEYLIKTNSTKLKNRTSKQAKLERDRFSILTNDLDHCVICGSNKDHLHEVFYGRNRLNSIKYGLVIPLCSLHHMEMHKNIDWQDYWHKKGQKAFIANYPYLDFSDIFKTNYL